MSELLSEPAVVLCSDKNYQKHVKYLVKNIRDKGEFAGVIYLISPDIKQEEIDFDTNLVVVPCPYENNHFYYKYQMFGDYFTYLTHRFYLYLDLDCLVQKPLQAFFENNRWEDVVVDFEPFTMKQILHYDDPGRRWVQTEELLGDFGRHLLDRPVFNAGVMLIGHKVIQKHSYRNLKEASQHFAGINFHAGKGSDQPIFNRAFMIDYPYANVLNSKDIVFWRDVDMADATIVHFCHEDAPWNNTDYSSVLGMTYLEYYRKMKND